MSILLIYSIVMSVMMVQEPETLCSISARKALASPQISDTTLRQLAEIGDKLFPLYHELLTTDDTPKGQISRVLYILSLVKVNATEFAEVIAKRITNEDYGIKTSSIELLSKIGTPSQVPAVCIAMCDARNDVVLQSAKTLSTIGNRDALLAFEVWLKSSYHSKDGDLRIHVVKCQRELKARLDKEAADQKKAVPPKK